MACQHERTSEVRSGILVCDGCGEPVTYAELLDRANPTREVSAMDELVAFLTARWDERERVALAAQAAAPGTWMRNDEGDLRSDGTGGNGYFATGPWGGGIDDAITEHMLLGDPASVLADIKAKRRILGLAADLQEREGRYAEDFVRALAQPYAGQDGWRNEWAA